MSSTNSVPSQTKSNAEQSNNIKPALTGKGGKKKSLHVSFSTLAAYTEELVVSTPSQRNWRGILIALLVIVAVLGLIVFSIVLVSPPEEGPRVTGRKPTLADILGPGLQTRRFNGSWISDTEFVYRDVHGGITVYNAENGTTRILMTNSSFRQLNAVDFRVSSDLRYVLLISDVTPIYKYTTLARYHVVEVATRLKFPLSWKEDDDQAPYLQYATWSPDGIGLAFVHDNDVYYKPKINGSLICKITKNGIPGVIYNGVPDWIYENEILHTGHTLWFSNDGKYLMYMTFNDTNVGDYQYPWYDSANARSSYPKMRSIRYPKVDTPNPEVTVSVVFLKRLKYLFPIEVRPTNSVEPNSYVTSVSWYSDHQVAVVWLNRRQNVSVVAVCRSPNFNCTNLHIEKESCGWTEPILHPVFSRHGGQCLARLPVQDGDRGNYMHVCLIQAGNVIPITHGPFELTKIIAWDEDQHLIYVIATSEAGPGQRHLYKIGDTNSSIPWTCLTCDPSVDPDLTQPENETSNTTRLLYQHCDYNSIIFSPTYKYYIQECLGPELPVTYLVETSSNNRIAVLDSSASVRKRIGMLALPQIKQFGVEIDSKYRAQVRLYYPPGLREHEEITFPLILMLDSKPGSQQVSDQWAVTWPWYLASNRNFIVAQIDAGGSGYQGENMRRQVLEALGTVEVTDQLVVLKYLTDTFKFIDDTRICVVGKGYGGYVAAMMIAEDAMGIINCSVSISPISSWLFYSSYFTEKFLGYPGEHLAQYERADLTKKVGNINGRHFLLVHGTADTVVKPQHSVMLARALIDEGVLFRQLVYPDEGHSFKGSKIHLYTEIDQFFDDSFGPISLDEWESDSGLFIQ